METPPTIPLAITKQSSVLDGITLLEYLPVNRVKALIKSNLLKVEKVENKYGLIKSYENEKQQLQYYLKNYDAKTSSFKVKYVKPKHKWGRVLVADALGCTAFSKAVRNTLIDDLYYDFDLKNAQVDIIRNICMNQEPSINCHYISHYCDNREEVLKEISNITGLSRDKSKKLMLRLCFFGTFENFCEENEIDKNTPCPKFITDFTQELNEIAKKTKKVNFELYETARKIKEAKKEKNFIGSFYANYLQEYEFRVVEKITLYLMNNTELMNHPNINTSLKVGTYEYDGIKLLKENVDKIGKNEVVKILNDITSELTGFKLTWEEKVIEKKYDISEWLNIVSENETPDSELMKTCKQITDKFDDTGVIETVMEILPNNFMFCKGEWFCWNGFKWENNSRPLENAITYKVAEYWKGLLEPYVKSYTIDDDCFDNNSNILKKTIKDLDNFIKQHLRDNTQINKCVARGKTLLANDYVEFDTNPDLFGFKNGVFDFKEECFRPYRFNDYITFSCKQVFKPIIKGMKYIENENGEDVMKIVENDLTGNDLNEMNDIKDLLISIFPDEELREFMLFVLSTGLSGRAIEKFFVFNGNGRNGKGMLNEFMDYCLGDYFGKMDVTVITENQNKKSSKDANPALALINKKRYVLMSEPSNTSLINNNVVKELTGGGTVCARNLHSSNTTVNLCLTLVLECNDKPNFKEEPKQADAERICDTLFSSFYTNDESLWDDNKHIYKVNPELKTIDWKNKHCNAMLNTLISYLLILKNDNYIIDKYVPQSVKNRSFEYLQKSFDLHDIFTTLFEKQEKGVEYFMKNDEGVEIEQKDWTLAKIVSEIKKSYEFRQLPKKKIAKDYSAKQIKTFFETNKFYKGFIEYDTHTLQTYFKGWRRKNIDEDDI